VLRSTAACAGGAAKGKKDTWPPKPLAPQAAAHGEMSGPTADGVQQMAEAAGAGATGAGEGDRRLGDGPRELQALCAGVADSARRGGGTFRRAAHGQPEK